MYGQVIVVTGASGFIAAHVVAQLLDAGYKVNGTVRSDEKGKYLKGLFPANVRDHFNPFVVEDIVSGDFGPSLKGANAVIHMASPLGSKGDANHILNGAIEGTMNLLRQGTAAGIKKIVLTSSIVAVSWGDYLADHTLTDQEWNPHTREMALADQSLAYGVSKKLAEQAAWEWVEKHPEIDLTALNPPYVFGPFYPGLPETLSGVGSLRLLFPLINGEEGRPIPATRAPQFIDVRDAARAHVLALKPTPNVPKGQKKRFIIYSAAKTYREEAELLHRERPALKGRLPDLTKPAPADPEYITKFDVHPAKDVLGFECEVPWEKSILDGVDSLIEAEKRLGA